MRPAPPWQRLCWALTGVLLLVAGVAALTAGVWTQRKSWVVDFDADLRERYLERHGEALAEAQKAFDAGEMDRAEELLRASLEAHREVGKRDLLEPIVRKERRLLMRVYRKSGRLPEAVEVAREITVFDDRDVPAKLSLARALFDSGAVPDGVLPMNEIARFDPLARMDGHAWMRERFVDWHLKREDWAGALALGEPLQRAWEQQRLRLEREGVKLAWQGPEGDAHALEARSAPAEEGWRLEAELAEPTARRLELQLPELSALEIRGLHWSFEPEGGSLRGAAARHSLRDLEEKGGALRVRGEAPAVIVPIPPAFRARGGRVEVRFRVLPRTVERLEEAARLQAGVAVSRLSERRP